MQLQKHLLNLSVENLPHKRFRTACLLGLLVGGLCLGSFSTAAQATESSSSDSLRQGVPGRRVGGGTR